MLSLEQMVDPESMVRIIDAFVDMLTLEQFDFNYFKLNSQGGPPYHPSTIMKLYLYGDIKTVLEQAGSWKKPVKPISRSCG